MVCPPLTHWREEGLAPQVLVLAPAVRRPHSEEDDPPVAEMILEEVGMAGTLDGVGLGVPMAEDGVVRTGFVRPPEVAAAGCRHPVAIARPALGGQ